MLRKDTKKSGQKYGQKSISFQKIRFMMLSMSIPRHQKTVTKGASVNVQIDLCNTTHPGTPSSISSTIKRPNSNKYPKYNLCRKLKHGLYYDLKRPNSNTVTNHSSSNSNLCPEGISGECDQSIAAPLIQEKAKR
jgi:hypothetical protein